MWGKLIALATDTWIRVYEYELKVTGLFQEILSCCSFGNFILAQSDEFSAREKWLEWYDTAIKAYGYYILLPCVAKVYGDHIERDPNLRSYFHSWNDYNIIYNRILTEDQYSRDDLQGIAKAFADFFSPIVKGFMMVTGTIFTFLRDLINAGAYALWDIARQKKFDVPSIINTVTQRFNGIGQKMRVANIPPEFYYQQRPTLDFDIWVLFANIQSYIAYKQILETDIEAQLNSPLRKDLTAELRVEGELIDVVKLMAENKLRFCLDKEFIQQNRGKKLTVELGGISPEALL